MPHARGEEQGLALVQVGVRLRDLLVGSGSVHRFIERSRLEVPRAPTDVARVPLHRHAAAVDVGQIPVFDTPFEVAGEHDVLEHVGKTAVVTAAGRGGKAHVQARLQIVVDLLVAGGEGVVRLIGDDEVEVAGVKRLLQPALARKGLHGGGDDFLAMAVLGGLLHAHWAVKVLDGLVDEFVSVGEHEHAAVSGDVGEGDGLAEARGHLNQMGAGGETGDHVDAFALVVA